MDLSYVKSLSFPLPEELEKLKGAGYFDEFKERAKYHLNRENLPDEVKKRIILEMHNSDVKLREYTLTEDVLIEQIAEYAPGFSRDDFKKLAGDTDYIFVNGEKRYVDFSVSSLFITSELLTNWPGSTYLDDKSPEVSESRDHMRSTGSAEVDIDVEFIADINPDVAKGNKLSVHLPYPSPQGLGMSDIEFISSSKSCDIAPEDALQRTVHFSADGSMDNSFKVRCRAKMKQTYMSFDDIISAGNDTTDAREAELLNEIRQSDLCEKYPHYVFTPFIKSLSDLIIGDQTDKTLIVKKIYDFITHRYRYAYVRDYAAIDALSEYFALRGRGDCGLQASLLITLCRYNGIPARWQSGIVTDGECGGAHDWAAVYFRGVGFRPVDPSFGGGAVRRGSEDDCEFYCGNIDPYRLIFNTDIQEEFTVTKKHYRYDPYDNQYGEVETEESMVNRQDVKLYRIIHSKKIK